MSKIAFLTKNQDLIPWIEGEAKAFPFEVLFGSDKPADAYVVLAEEGDAEEFLPLIEGRMFAWFGDGAIRAKALHPFLVQEDWGQFNADDLLIAAQDMHVKCVEDKRKEKEASKPERPTLTKRFERPDFLKRRHEEEGPEEVPSFSTGVSQAPPQVIAVGGSGGASFVAWNLAAITQLSLIEGRDTGSLATWTGDHTPVRQALDDTLAYGTVSEGPLPKSIIGQRVIVDTGPDPRHPVFEQARIRIWVTTLDPAAPPIPERAQVVVNRMPDPLPFDPSEVVKAKMTLRVPDGGLDALISLFTHIPWILKQPREVQEQWKSLVKTKMDTEKGADPWETTGW